MYHESWILIEICKFLTTLSVKYAESYKKNPGIKLSKFKNISANTLFNFRIKIDKK